MLTRAALGQANAAASAGSTMGARDAAGRFWSTIRPDSSGSRSRLERIPDQIEPPPLTSVLTGSRDTNCLRTIAALDLRLPPPCDKRPCRFASSPPFQTAKLQPD